MKVIDLHCDTFMRLFKHSCLNFKSNNLHINLDNLKKGDYLLQTFAMFVNLNKVVDPYVYVNKMIEKYYYELQVHNQLIKPIYCYQNIIDNTKSGVISSLLSIEEGAVLKGKLSNLFHLYKLGVRMMTLTWNYENEIGFPSTFNKCIENRTEKRIGLKPFGLKVIQEMERIGMIIDVSHLSDDGFYDVYNNTTKPFVASHSNARSICNHPRNLTDDMICKIAARGGIIGINFCSLFVEENATVTLISGLIKHINYIKEIAGIDVIALGTDFDGIDNELEIPDASKIFLLEKELYQNNYSKEEVEKIFYGNALYFFKKVL